MTLRPRQNGGHVAGNIFKCIFFLCFHWNVTGIGSSNGSLRNKWQAITCANVDLDVWCSMVPVGHIGLIHWGKDKMAAIFADNIFMCIFLNKNFWISNKISLKYVP